MCYYFVQKQVCFCRQRYLQDLQRMRERSTLEGQCVFAQASWVRTQISNTEHCNQLVGILLETSQGRCVGRCYLLPGFSSTCGNLSWFWRKYVCLKASAAVAASSLFSSSLSAFMSAWVLPVLLCLLSLIYTHLTTYALHSPLIHFLPNRQNVSHCDKSLCPCKLDFGVFSVN